MGLRVRLPIGKLEDARAFTIRKPLSMRGSVCVEMMTTFHGSVSSLWRHAEGCVPSESTIAYIKDPLKTTLLFLKPP